MPLLPKYGMRYAEIISEAVHKKLRQEDDSEISVWFNPTHRDTLALVQKFPNGLRGMVNNEMMAVWSAYEAAHGTMMYTFRDNGISIDDMTYFIMGGADMDFGNNSFDFNGWGGEPNRQNGLSWLSFSGFGSRAGLAATTLAPFLRAVTPPIKK